MLSDWAVSEPENKMVFQIHFLHYLYEWLSFWILKCSIAKDDFIVINESQVFSLILKFRVEMKFIRDTYTYTCTQQRFATVNDVVVYI